MVIVWWTLFRPFAWNTWKSLENRSAIFNVLHISVFSNTYTDYNCMFMLCTMWSNPSLFSLLSLVLAGTCVNLLMAQCAWSVMHSVRWQKMMVLPALDLWVSSLHVCFSPSEPCSLSQSYDPKNTTVLLGINISWSFFVKDLHYCFHYDWTVSLSSILTC